MAIDDAYDRSGQYENGDRGPKVSGYSPMAPDRRDVAVGTMVGEGYKDSREGYAAVLDTIENRISAIDKTGGWGEGYFGTGSHTKMGDRTLEGVAYAPNQFSTWNDDIGHSRGIAERARDGRSKPGAEQSWHDQAQEVYDSYYGDGFGRGITRGATSYQNNSAVSSKAGRAQRGMQAEYGSTRIGSHTFTGPWFGTDELSYSPPATSVVRAPEQPITGYEGWEGDLRGWSDDLSPQYGEDISGSFGQNRMGHGAIRDRDLGDVWGSYGFDEGQYGAWDGNWDDRIGTPISDYAVRGMAEYGQPAEWGGYPDYSERGLAEYGQPAEWGGMSFSRGLNEYGLPAEREDYGFNGVSFGEYGPDMSGAWGSYGRANSYGPAAWGDIGVRNAVDPAAWGDEGVMNGYGAPTWGDVGVRPGQAAATPWSSIPPDPLEPETTGAIKGHNPITTPQSRAIAAQRVAAPAVTATAQAGGTVQNPDGTVSYSDGGQAFGPGDPFGGLGFGDSSPTDVRDSFDSGEGMTGSFADSGWHDSQEAANAAVGLGPDFGGGWADSGGWSDPNSGEGGGGGK